jgi:class 3 adenylate cyclase/tetratricopeptide (TPR) repeat protein
VILPPNTRTVPSATASGPSGLTPGGEPEQQLLPYAPRLALEWLSQTPDEEHHRVDGTLVFVDVAGFTALTERLAARGRAGAEEINEIVSSTFGELASIAGRYGADLLKWGGDAAVLLFQGPGSGPRGARCGWLMARAMRRLGRLQTSAGRIELEVSVGAHSGSLELFLIGETHRELIVAGPGATLTTEMEAAASAGEVVVSAATAALLDATVLGDARGHGILLRGEPAAEERPVSTVRPGRPEDATMLVPERARQYLLSGEEQAEHRPLAIGFVKLSGLDGVIEQFGASAALRVLRPAVSAAQRATEHHGVSFHGTDLAAGGVKILLVGGVPKLEGNDTDRLVRSALEIVRQEDGTRQAVRSSGLERASAAGTAVTLRAGVNAGHAFVFSGLHLGGRRVYSITGDAVNLAARVVETAEPGQVRCTEATRAGLRSPFVLRELPPFMAKGKTGPIVTYEVRRETASHAGTSSKQPVFVGRRGELNALLSAAVESRAGDTGSVVELVGAQGIGKSRLVDEAVQAWPLSTYRIACDSFSGGRPYWPLRASARQLLGLDDDAPGPEVAAALMATLEEKAPALRPWAPLLADVFDVAVPPTREVGDLEPRFRRRRLEAAFVELTETLVGGPAAFVFEDTHALDQASASLVLRIAEQTEVSPWLVVLTRRSDGPGWADLAGRTVIELRALDGSASEHLLADLSPEGLSPRDRQVLVERAGGNPLFLVELARAARDTGSPETLPDALEPLLAAQVDRLSPPDRRALRAAAVLGLRFESSLLAQVVDSDVHLDDALGERLSPFLREEEGELLFAHALVRDAAYEGLSFRTRRLLHGRAAQAIEQRANGTPLAVELLSLHWLAAERWDRAWECARLAGERAAALYANADAATQFGRALDAASHLRELSRAEVAHVGEMLGDACELAGNYERAHSAYGTACRRLHIGAQRARLLRKMGVLQERRGRYPQALRTYTSALRHLTGDDHAGLVERCELKLAVAGVRHRQDRLRDSAAEAVAAAADAEQAGYRPGLAHALYLRHINSVYLDEPDDSLAEEALSIFTDLGNLVGQGNVLNNLGISAHYRGDWPLALERYRASRAARERTGDLVGAATEDNNIGEILSDQGHYAEAERCFNAAKSSWRAASYTIGEALATSNLGRLAARTGRTLRGASLLEEARGAFEAIHAPSYVDETDLRLAECTLLAGELQRAAETGADLTARFARRGDSERLLGAVLRLRAVALAQLGDTAQAETLLDESITRLRMLAEGFELAQALAARAELRRRTRAVDTDGAAGEMAIDAAIEAAIKTAIEAAAKDEADAQAIFARLGVEATFGW